jgi:hypothetical protein
MTAVTDYIIPGRTINGPYQKVYASIIDDSNILVNPAWDTINVTYPSVTSTTYTFLKSGVTSQTTTLVYETSSKAKLVSVTRS